MNNYSGRLIELRGGLTQEEAAKEIGISRTALTNYETGTRFPNRTAMQKIAKYYKKTVDEIFFDHDVSIRNQHSEDDTD